MSWLALVRSDAARWVDQTQIIDPVTITRREIIGVWYRFVAFRPMIWFRLGQMANRRGIPGLPSYCQRRIMRKFGLEILIGGDIGPGLYVPHPVGTVLSSGKVGANCTFVGAVTLGMRDGEFPVIGDEVYVGAGARIIGGITIGDRAKVGANAVVVRDVEPDTSVVGIPAKPIASQAAPTGPDGEPEEPQRAKSETRREYPDD